MTGFAFFVCMTTKYACQPKRQLVRSLIVIAGDVLEA
jgi:hypothetical protein